MLPRTQRVSKRLFEEALKKAKKLHGAHLTLALSKGESGTRCAFVVSKKVASKAVKRNWLRRRLFVMYRGYNKQIPAGFILMFFVKKAPSTYTAKDMLVYKEDMRLLLEKAFNISLS